MWAGPRRFGVWVAPAPRWGRVLLFACCGPRLPPPSRGRVLPGRARRLARGRASARVCARALPPRCVPWGEGQGGPPRLRPPLSPRREEPPHLSRSRAAATGGGAWATGRAASLGSVSPGREAWGRARRSRMMWVLDGQTRETDGRVSERKGLPSGVGVSLLRVSPGGGAGVWEEPPRVG